jgi:hypothetical protein
MTVSWDVSFVRRVDRHGGLLFDSRDQVRGIASALDLDAGERVADGISATFALAADLVF